MLASVAPDKHCNNNYHFAAAVANEQTALFLKWEGDKYLNKGRH